MDANDCRNLACTNFFSKILEGFVLESLQAEVKLEEQQYGGITVSYTHLTLPTIYSV